MGLAYRQHAAGERYDAIVVGSGIGGLATAALLAKHAGKRVLVLERHYVAGGFTHAFRRPGFDWDVGLHYIGDMQTSRALTRRLFDHIGDGSLQWTSMGSVYDRIVIERDHYDFAAGADAFRDGLAQAFPGQRATLDRYLALIRAATRSSHLYFTDKALPDLLSALVGPLLRARFLRHAQKTTAQALAGLVRDPRLLGVLTGQWGDYGLPPARSSFAMHALLARHYLWGGSYPVGGGAAIAASIAPTIEAAGGTILVGAEVAQLVLEGDCVIGVRMADGTEIRAPLVISDAGAANTYLRLLPAAATTPHGIPARLQALGTSLAHVGLYLGLDRSADELALPRHNLWLYPGHDHDANVARFLADREAPLPVVYVSFPSAKDPDFARRHPGHATIEVITLGPYEWFAAWEQAPWRRRGEDYEALKARFAERMREALYAQVPAARGHVTACEVSTPLSTRHFANYAAGEVYGIEHSPARFAETLLRPRTPFRGLYLTGQDVVTCGIAGALAAGVLTASAVLGRNLMARAARG